MVLVTALLIYWAVRSPRPGDPRDAQATRWWRVGAILEAWPVTC